VRCTRRLQFGRELLQRCAQRCCASRVSMLHLPALRKAASSLLWPLHACAQPLCLDCAHSAGPGVLLAACMLPPLFFPHRHFPAGPTCRTKSKSLWPLMWRHEGWTSQTSWLSSITTSPQVRVRAVVCSLCPHALLQCKRPGVGGQRALLGRCVGEGRPTAARCGCPLLQLLTCWALQRLLRPRTPTRGG